ncbi:MAG: hypothetical protein KI786_02205 [Mameliella sp.]|nr:hypothetical protein [Phaeodactylibacter sp.]
MIVAFPHPPGHGSLGSFQSRFERALQNQHWQGVYASSEQLPDVVIVVGGTKRLLTLAMADEAGRHPHLLTLRRHQLAAPEKKVGVRSYVL